MVDPANRLFALDPAAWNNIPAPLVNAMSVLIETTKAQFRLNSQFSSSIHEMSSQLAVQRTETKEASQAANQSQGHLNNLVSETVQTQTKRLKLEFDLLTDSVKQFKASLSKEISETSRELAEFRTSFASSVKALVAEFEGKLDATRTWTDSQLKAAKEASSAELVRVHR